MSLNRSFHKPNRPYKTRRQSFTGTLQANERGFAFIIPDDKERFAGDFFVPKISVNGACHGDKVLAERIGHGDEARVIKVISQGFKSVTGTLCVFRNKAVLSPDNTRYPEVQIPLSLLRGGKDGDKAQVEITSRKKNFAVGKVTEILGRSGELQAEEISIIRSYDLEEEFPPEVIKESEKSAREPILSDGREDLRDKLIFTIDGVDTRDIDDGVSLERNGENFVLGVHIADVSRYVKFRSNVDKNAYSRGTSVYFPDRVLPMLPKSLSNGACSLNEGEDRYAVSCFMTFDKGGKRIDYRLCESIIRSRHKLSYPDVTAVINGSPELNEKYSDIAPTLKLMQSLCLLLEKRRNCAGAVNLDIEEAHIYVDGDGKITIPKAERTISERIIEQFMISANEAVADFITKHRAPCLYRIHQSPAPEKAEALIAFLKILGVNVEFDPDEVEPADFAKILKEARDKPYSGILSKVMLRSMQKAKYSERNAGHFGLASACYCHFTSPIRRYPDLFVHRVVKDILHGSNKAKAMYGGFAEEAGLHLSDRERIADEAERKVDDLYKLEYMSERLGENFTATISGVTAFGIFCELENTVEGLIPVEDLPEDNYIFHEESYTLKGAKRKFRLGDKVEVCAVACDLNRLKTIFRLKED